MELTILKPLLDLFFPVKCESCFQPKNESSNPLGWLCFDCQKKIFLNDWVFCPACNKKSPPLPQLGEKRNAARQARATPEATAWQACSKHKTALRWLGAAGNYEDSVLKPLIWRFKYGFSEEIGEVLSRIIFKYFEKIFEKTKLDKEKTIISFIPLSPKKERWRGFNQSRVLAQNLAAKTGFKLVETLERKKHRPPMMSLQTKEQRLENIKNSFAPKNPLEFRHKDILVVDDVCATGATLLEAGKTLKQSGADNVFGLVLARRL
ncbi:TPA: hypothetical protein DEX28_02785 [Patescibacteria group bacterium]|nr:MAG: Amidophosphoribosyltransferase [Parcubacteria group bacterium GW2011_GWB1_45_10]HCI05649.1 hypothetical protein [Patescibacteria group bacterium]